jgi:hypothetical protein
MKAGKRQVLGIVLVLYAAVLFAQAQEPVTYTGYLVDIACAAVHRTRDDSWAVVHKRDCLSSPESAKSGFALVMPKGKIFRFDPTGNAKAIALINTLIKKEHRDDHWLVEVVGQAKSGPDGDTIAVQSIRLK